MGVFQAGKFQRRIRLFTKDNGMLWHDENGVTIMQRGVVQAVRANKSEGQGAFHVALRGRDIDTRPAGYWLVRQQTQ